MLIPYQDLSPTWLDSQCAINFAITVMAVEAMNERQFFPAWRYEVENKRTHLTDCNEWSKYRVDDCPCQKREGAELAQRLFDEAFAVARQPRSVQYKKGVLSLLHRQIVGVIFSCPYIEGTADFDAFYSGVEEGWAIYAKNFPEHWAMSLPEKSAVLR